MATPQTLTTKQVIAGFAVGHMTIYNWRAGTPKQDPLPHTVDSAGRVTFKASEVKAWAKKYGRPFTVPTTEAEVVKPGPKPRSTPVDRSAEKAAKVETAARKTKAGAKQADAVSKAMETATKSSKLGRQISAVAKKQARKAAVQQAAA